MDLEFVGDAADPVPREILGPVLEATGPVVQVRSLRCRMGEI
jgi:hypothetical protein